MEELMELFNQLTEEEKIELLIKMLPETVGSIERNGEKMGFVCTELKK